MTPEYNLMRGTAYFIALASALGSTAFAQEQEQESPLLLGRIVLTTDRVGEQLLDVPANITVIDGETISERQITDIEELTRRLPGVNVFRQVSGADPFSSFSGFTIRGVGGNRVAIQVDGGRTAERIIDGTRDYLDLNFTKSVEIVRGPASVLWGADALGGIVAFETIDPEDLLRGEDRAVQVTGGYNSFDESLRSSLTFGQKLSDDLEVVAGLAQEVAHEPNLTNARNDGGIYGCPRNIDFGATPCGEFDPTDTMSTRGLLKGVWTPTGTQRFEFTLDALQRDTSVQQNYVLGPDDLADPDSEVINNKDRFLDLQRTRYATEHTWTPDGSLFSELKTTVAYTQHGYERSGTESSISSDGDSIFSEDTLRFDENFLELDIQATSEFTTGWAEHRLLMGFDGDVAKTDYLRIDIVNNLTAGTTTEQRGGGFNFANATTTRADIYIADQISLLNDALEITPGLRFASFELDPRPDADYQEVPGSEPKVREDTVLLRSLGLVYRFDDNWSVWGKYGEGFKMPTAQQLYTSLPGFFNLIPAPDLRPEEVESVELGFRFEQENGFVAINAFKSDYSDFIQNFYFIPDTNNITYRNISVVNVQGIEASAGWAISDTTQLDFSAAWQEGTQRVTPEADETPHTVQPLTATLGLTHEFAQLGLTLEGVLTMVADVKETAGDDDFKPDGYTVLDMYGKYALTENAALNFSIGNIFDERYFTASAASYSTDVSDNVAATNPIELQTGPGRTFGVSFDVTF